MEEFELLVEESLDRLEAIQREAKLREIDRLLAAIDELEASLDQILQNAPAEVEFHAPGAEKVRS